MIQFDSKTGREDTIAFAQKLTKFAVNGNANFNEEFTLEGYGISVEVTATASVPFDIFVIAVDEDNARKLVENATSVEIRQWINWDSAEFDIDSPSYAVVDDDYELRSEMKYSADLADIDVDDVNEVTA
jgi:hypothetical protein